MLSLRMVCASGGYAVGYNHAAGTAGKHVAGKNCMNYYQYTRLHCYVRYGAISTCEVVNCAITEEVAATTTRCHQGCSRYIQQ